ncbi:MAG TPA: DNA-processing protein DprA [Candidatus Saccharimonadales bacterium]|nr:DNA-processing protein DprA [Candidatus Saccharimonadales bacterium]
MTVNMLKLTDSEYPAALRTLSQPPEQIYWTGAAPTTWLSQPKVAVVGSRKITPYGRAVTSKIAGQLAQADVVIISGLAFGVDITAHQAALAAGGITVAVLPAGLDYIYPVAHSHIAQQITRKGTLITEYSEGAIGFKSNFIARNRIVSGLCDVLLITEAAVNSGSLHTARFALEQGKTVMAVPGNITSPISEGTNNLIKSGAIPVTSADDIFFAMGLSPQIVKQRNFKGTASEQAVLSYIKDGVTGQDELATVSALDSRVLASTLTMLELEGLIRPAGGGNWVLA